VAKISKLANSQNSHKSRTIEIS